MKKIIFLILSICAFISPVFADSYLNLDQFLRGYLSVVTYSIAIPNSYTSIQLKFSNVRPKMALYPLLQKAVYLDIFPNAKIALPLNQKITEFQATSIIHTAFPFVETGDKTRFVSLEWLKTIALSLQTMQIKTNAQLSADKNSPDVFMKSELYQDVMYRLNSTYYFQSGLDQTGMLYGGIEGMVKGLHDPYTVFFPPVEADQFEDEIQGQFFGIGAYLEMTQPGILIITSTIPGGPAQKADLLPQDRIVQVDDHAITAKVSSSQAVHWIKGISGTEVILKILRNGKILTFPIKRAQIVIPNIVTTLYTGSVNAACLVSLHLFDSGMARRFGQALSGFNTQNCSKYIFDLRNNPGGSLEEVVNMLDYFVPTGLPIVSVKSRIDQQILYADSSTKLTGENIRILVNKGSASASEIFAGVVREYIPNALLVGTQTYGKGSVQDVIYYDDGSLLKYTVAKRYTGKKDVNIDGIGFTPDVLIEDKVGSGKDAILDRALKN